MHPPASTAVVDAAREALDEHNWERAYELLVAADQEQTLPGTGLRLLTEAAWWCGQPEQVLEFGERAYTAFLDEGASAAAAMVAFELAEQHAIRMSPSMAGGWFARAERLVEDDPDAPVHAYLAWMRGVMALEMQRDPETAAAQFDEAQQVARRLGDRNAEVRSLHDKGRALCLAGRIAEGAALMDEAMVAATSGELDPMPTGIVYCSMIGVCYHFSDYQRAAEWTEATTRWCDRYAISGFPGLCRVHRAGIMRMRGAWAVAEEEARRACDELPRFNLFVGLGTAFYEIGEVRRRMGDFAGAEEAYGQAHEHGREPEPGLSLVRLAQGRADAAAAGVRRVLADDGLDRVARAQPLAAQVEIALVTGDLDTASDAAEELTGIADDVDTTALHAIAAGARGAVRLAHGDPDAAITQLRRALRAWQQIDAPYESAEVRVLLGKAYRDQGDTEGAVLELRAARDAFERLGGTWAAERTAELLGELTARAGAPERARRAFVFTDIVRSTDLVAAIGDEAWEELLAWHDQTLRSLFAAHGGEVAHHTGDGFFVSFADVDEALRCAVGVQRALADHRRQHGFAPLVRIGVHHADAIRRGQDFSGAQVHKAARIAGEAAGGEILVSTDALASTLDDVTTSEPRELTLKGVADPVQVVAVEWR